MPAKQSGWPDSSGAGGGGGAGGGECLVVLMGPESSLSPTDIVVSCDGLARLHFLGDSTDPKAAGLWPVVSSLAPTTLVDFSDEAACLEAVRAAGATAVTTFVERLCRLSVRLNRLATGYTGNEVLWGRKDLHRETMRGAGLSRIRSAPIRDAGDLAEFVRTVGFPFIIKPIDGFGSRDTWLVADESDAAAFLGRAVTGPAGQIDGMFAEEFIVALGPTSPGLAEYLSVEVYRSGVPGAASGTFVTHRPPMASDFRETGLVLPSPLTAEQQRPLIALAEGALDAVRARRGAFHVEMIPTAKGTEIIELNGRIGGFIARAVRHGTGTDLGRQALSCALGREPALDLRWNRCVLGLFFQPPVAARAITAAPGRREVSRLPGVIAVEEIMPAGTDVHSDDGDFGMVARLWLAADDHTRLCEHLADVGEFLTERFEYVDEYGRAVRDLSWLETLSEMAGTERAL